MNIGEGNELNIDEAGHKWRLSLGRVCHLPKCLFNGKKLNSLYDSGKLAEFYSALHDAGPEYFQSDKFSAKRIASYKEFKAVKCEKERPALREQLASLERLEKFEEMRKAGESCSGTNQEIDTILALAKNPIDLKIARMSRAENLAEAKKLIADNTRNIHFEADALDAASKNLVEARSKKLLVNDTQLPNLAEISSLEKDLLKKRIFFAKELIAKDREEEALSMLNAAYGTQVAVPEVKAVYERIARNKEQRSVAAARAEISDRRRAGVSIGMSRERVIQSQWGRPKKINKTVNAFGTNEQWVYDGGYLYFENGILTTIQQ